MSKRGFTLIEILGVVIVLAIISIISIPIILNITEGIRKSALETSVKGLIASADIYYTRNMDKISSPIEFVVTNGQQEGTKKLSYNGKVENAYLMLFENNDKAVCADDGKYAASKGVNDKKITVEKGNCLGYDEAYKGYVVGDANGFTSLNIKAVTDASQLGIGKQNYIRVITTTSITGFYVSATPPVTPSQGMVWVVQANNSPYYLESDEVKIGVSYVMQYEDNKWMLKQAYVYNKDAWKLLYYVDMTDGNLNIENSNLGDIQITKNYQYTGEYQEFTAVFSGYYNIQAWGAQGGSYGYAGGLGAYTSGKVYLNAGDTIYIYVGGTSITTTAGWNGGSDSTAGSAGSGGATDVRLKTGNIKTDWSEFDSLKSRIMVAAGGGSGMSADGNYGTGGAGGGLVGYTASGNNNPGTGGTQSQAGYDSGVPTVSLGGFGYGGKGTRWTYNGSGGGGYYGGGGGYASAGGGGSSYISGHNGCSSIEENSTSTNIIHNGNPYHYSGYYFIETSMIDGQGYSWGVKKDSAIINQPKHDGSGTQVGNSGNGYAVITLKTVEYKDNEKIVSEQKNEQWNYTYSGTNSNEGRYQMFYAPHSGYYNMELWGAQGGSYGYSGGLGAYTSGDIYLEKGTKLYIYVGGTSTTTAAGWNGGSDSTAGSAGSGGATDIRIDNTSKITLWNEFDSLKSRIMVAAGGGSGMSADGNYGTGGAGGGLVGYTASGNNNPGTGGTQSQAGYDSGVPTVSLGGFGYGGKGTRWTYNGAGGGGYYGGGGGFASAGGGGSSYISGHNGCSSIEKISTLSNIIHNGDKYHYSGYYFNNTIMIDGQGYLWNNIKGDSVIKQPTHDGSSMQIGNASNGYAKITSKTKESIEPEEITGGKKLDTWNYMYSGTNLNTGRYQLFTTQESGYYNIELWGAQGGAYGYAGGLGAYTSGDIYLEKGTKLYIYVGGTTITTTAGWNGGSDSTAASAGSGGATDIRITSTGGLTLWNEFDSLKSRIMVAAGGGSGMSADGNYGTGGAGGGLVGYTASGNNNPGTGGTQSQAGYDSGVPTVSLGGFGYGGKGTRWTYNGAGGGGYYGGGGGFASAGGGGSSYISGHNGCSSIEENSTSTNIIHNGNPYHYNNYFFLNTMMIDGQGYSWGADRSTSVIKQPNYSNSSMQIGNSGNGYARITLKSKKELTIEEVINTRSQNEWDYMFSGTSPNIGRYQIFIAEKTGFYNMQLWGAQGGAYGYPGGLGAYTSGEIYLTKGTRLYIYVGGTTITTTAGWNGGSDSTTCSAGSGGATDIRVVNTSQITLWNELPALKSRIMVAAGGGSGTSDSGNYGTGGAGGGLIGYTASGVNNPGTGGTQTTGGYDSGAPTVGVGGFGYGGKGTRWRSNGSGGGGYYGGGGGYASAGGGGSSYISGHAGCIAVTSSGTPKVETYSSLSDSISYTGYKFVSTQMIDGQGYSWTIIKSGATGGMPSQVGTSVITGNAGNGYAKITYLGE